MSDTAQAAMNDWYSLDGKGQLEILSSLQADAVAGIQAASAKGGARTDLPLLRGQATLCHNAAVVMVPPDPGFTALWMSLLDSCEQGFTELIAAVDTGSAQAYTQAVSVLNTMTSQVGQAITYLKKHLPAAAANPPRVG